MRPGRVLSSAQAPDAGETRAYSNRYDFTGGGPYTIPERARSHGPFLILVRASFEDYAVQTADRPRRADELNPMARFPLHMMAAFAELEREIIRERVVAGVKAARANEKWRGRRSARSGTIKL